MQINTIRLRAMIGWLGMLLPWIVVLLVGYFPHSISATWYTNACTPFMIILGSAGFLLISYKGYEVIDDVILTCSFMISQSVSSVIHYIAAVMFFGLLAYKSFFLFTKSSGEMTTNKKIRNIIYRVCGVGMVASFLILLLPNFSCKVWLMETIALLFFGVSFLTKADIYPWLFCDTPYTD